MEQQGWNVAQEVIREFGWAWSLALVGLFLLLSRLNVVKRLFVERHKTQLEERELLSEEMQNLIGHLQKDAEKQRIWRIEEGERSDRTIATLRADITRLTSVIESSEKGNSRLRHALNNALSWGAELRRQLIMKGGEYPPFPLSDLMDVDPELGRKLTEIFADGDRLAGRTRGA